MEHIQCAAFFTHQKMEHTKWKLRKKAVSNKHVLKGGFCFIVLTWSIFCRCWQIILIILENDDIYSTCNLTQDSPKIPKTEKKIFIYGHFNLYIHYMTNTWTNINLLEPVKSPIKIINQINSYLSIMPPFQHAILINRTSTYTKMYREDHYPTLIPLMQSMLTVRKECRHDPDWNFDIA